MTGKYHAQVERIHVGHYMAASSPVNKSRPYKSLEELRTFLSKLGAETQIDYRGFGECPDELGKILAMCTELRGHTQEKRLS